LVVFLVSGYFDHFLGFGVISVTF